MGGGNDTQRPLTHPRGRESAREDLLVMTVESPAFWSACLAECSARSVLSRGGGIKLPVTTYAGRGIWPSYPGFWGGDGGMEAHALAGLVAGWVSRMRDRVGDRIWFLRGGLKSGRWIDT